MKQNHHFLSLICFTLFIHCLSAQEVNLRKIGPFPEFKINELFISPEGMFYATSYDRLEIYFSENGEIWESVGLSFSSPIDYIGFVNDNNIIIKTEKTVEQFQNENLSVIYEFSDDEMDSHLRVSNNTIYLSIGGRLYAKEENDVDFNEVFLVNSESDKIDNLEVSDQHIFLQYDTELLVLTKTYETLKLIQLEASPIFFRVSHDDIVCYGYGIGSTGNDGNVQYTLAYSIDLGDFFRRPLFGINALPGRDVGFLGDQIFFSWGNNSIINSEISSNTNTHYPRFFRARFADNGTVAYIYNHNKIARLQSTTEEQFDFITTSSNFENYIISDYDIGIDGKLIALTGHNAFFSDNSGTSWEKLNFNNEKVLDAKIDYKGNIHVYTEHSYYYSQNNGLNFDSKEHYFYVDRICGFQTPQNGTDGTLNKINVLDENNICLSGYKQCHPLQGGGAQPLLTNINLESTMWGCIPGVGVSQIDSIIYLYDNKNSSYGAGYVFDYSPLSIWDKFNQLPPYVLITNEGLFHFNSVSEGRSFISRNHGTNVETLPKGPNGPIFQGPDIEGTYVYNSRLFYREQPNSNYIEYDLSSLDNSKIHNLDTDDDGNIFLIYGSNNFSNGFSVEGEFYLIDSTFNYSSSIRGQILIDENLNCQNDSELIDQLGQWKIIVSSADNNYIQYVSNGEFEIHTKPSNYEIKIETDSPLWEICNSMEQVELNTNENEVVNFLVSPVEYCSNLEASFNRPLIRKCWDIEFILSLKNMGTEATNGNELIVTTDKFLEIIEFPTEYEQLNDSTYMMAIDDLEAGSYDWLSFNVNVSCDAPLGHVHCISAEIKSENLCFGSESVASTVYESNIGPYDPNDIRIFNEAGHQAITFDTLDYQYYHIRFQNTGTDTAFNVKVETTLDDSLDISTIEILSSSHEFTPSFNDAQNLILNFDDIMLPDSNVNLQASNGYFAFKVKPIRNANYGTQINCSADIFFDYNDPIRTNTSTAILGIPCDEAIYRYEPLELCANDFETFDDIGLIYIQEGLHQYIKHSEECDTNFIYDLTINRIYSRFLLSDFCEDNIEGFMNDTTIYDTLNTINGCDSILKNQIRVHSWNHNSDFMEVKEICEGNNWFGYTESGTYIDTLFWDANNQTNNCHIRTLDLNVIEALDSIQISICEGENYQGFTEQGEYLIPQGTTNQGCQNFLVLDLNVRENSFTEIDTCICEGDEFEGFMEEGVHELVLENNIGCDSIVNINLCLLPLQQEGCLTSAIQLSEHDIQLYPVPFSDFIDVVGSKEIEKIRVISMTGIIQLEINASFNENRINTSILEQGFYIFEITTNEGTYISKIIKM